VKAAIVGSVIAAVLSASSCAPPRARALEGELAPERSLPAIELAAGHRRVVFRWDYEENALIARGEGAMRIASPDSARVDLFLAGGIPVGRAVLIGDEIKSVSQPQVERFLPPAALMWAAIGRLAIPPLPDTVITVEGELMHADIGRPAAWRVTIKGTRLMRLARLSGGRIAEVVTRDDGGRLLYEVPGRRKLWLGIIRDEEAQPFDASIWGP
jgi:hypothetical protein